MAEPKVRSHRPYGPAGLPSDRWRDDLRALLARAGLPGRVVTDPDLGGDAVNYARLRLLTEHRGYDTHNRLFRGLHGMRLAADGVLSAWGVQSL